MFWNRLNAWLDKLNDKLDKFNEKMDKGEDKLSVAVDRLENGYTSKDYDSDYQKYITKFSDMSSDELTKEKFLIQSALQTNKKDEDYSGTALAVSMFVLLSTILINFFDMYLSNMEIDEVIQKKVLILFTIGVLAILLVFILFLIARFRRTIKYSKVKQQYRLKIIVIDKILKEKIKSENTIV